MNGQAPHQNIVLCSDGTGQTGARVGGTNVWKVRMGVERHDHLKDSALPRQVVFYDAGVGTSKFSLTAMLGNAFGYGLSANIRQLYKDLAKTYNDGDHIYVFGFSRGAFTARSLAGMISEVGVLDGRRDNEELEQLVCRAYKAYRASPGHKNWPEEPSKPIVEFQKDCEAKGIAIRDAGIHFVGVWDTVDAYGMPVDELRVLIYDKILNKLRRPHNDGLTAKMKYAYQALAIDEDRHTFTPTLYNELEAKELGVELEQVWFAGAHSNVGGGYPRQGLSDLALYWMMTKAMGAGLRFSPPALADARRNMDGHSTLYDQRSGAGAIWRYLPRDVGKLAATANDPAGKLPPERLPKPKIHVSVLDRIELATADYGPITLPPDFEVVGTDDDDRVEAARFNGCVEKSAPKRERAAQLAWEQIGKRRRLYQVFLVALAVVATLVGFLRFKPEATKEIYQQYSLLHRLGGWLSEQSEGLTGIATEFWGMLRSIVLFVAPGGAEGEADKLVNAVFALPEGVILIALIAAYLIWRKRTRVARLRHMGLDLWRDCFRE